MKEYRIFYSDGQQSDGDSNPIPDWWNHDYVFALTSSATGKYLFFNRRDSLIEKQEVAKVKIKASSIYKIDHELGEITLNYSV